MKHCSLSLLPAMFMFIASCASSEDPSPTKQSELMDAIEGVDAPANSSAMAMGTFTSFAHGLTGNATVYTDANGARVLRFDSFTMTEGPDVYVLFSKTNNYSNANTVAISMLKGAYNNTSVNIEVDPTIDLSTHKFVLVYCVQFSSLFGYSELK